MALPSNYFKRSEFACKCGCGGDTIDAEYLHILDILRSHFNRPIIVHCGFRCRIQNRNVRSKDTSMHLAGKAVDFHIKNIPHKEVYDYLNRRFPNSYGIAYYWWGIHFDVREQLSRW